MANLGVPIKLLHEALGHVVTCELKTGQVSLSNPFRMGKDKNSRTGFDFTMAVMDRVNVGGLEQRVWCPDQFVLRGPHSWKDGRTLRVASASSLSDMLIYRPFLINRYRCIAEHWSRVSSDSYFAALAVRALTDRCRPL